MEMITKDPDYLDVGCFGAIRPLKNNLIQAIGAIKFARKVGKKLRFHMNGNRVENNGGQVKKNLDALFNAAGDDCTLVFHEWMMHDQFLNLVSAMDVGLQVSFSETFNIVAADFVACHVPIVVSSEIDWLPSLTYADPNSSADICKKMHKVWLLKEFNVHRLNNIWLHLYNRDAKKHWLNFVV